MKGNKIVSGMMWSFSEKIAAQVVSVVVSIILARLLMPDDYGVVAIVYIFTVIAEIFVTSGLGTALIQKKDADDTDFFLSVRDAHTADDIVAGVIEELVQFNFILDPVFSFILFSSCNCIFL